MTTTRPTEMGAFVGDPVADDAPGDDDASGDHDTPGDGDSAADDDPAGTAATEIEEAGFRLRYRVTAADGLSLVRIVVCNPAPVDRRVRIDNRLDGAVLAPRREGVPEAGWDDAGYCGTVPAGDSLTLGYACEAPPVRPPVAVSGRGRPDEADADDAPSPAAVVRRLGSPAPPRDAVPGPAATAPRGDRDRSPSALPAPAAEAGTTASETEGSPADEGSADEPSRPSEHGTHAAAVAWLDSVEARVELGERLTGASLAAATDAVDDAGGLAAVDDLPETLAADAARLAALAERAERLAARADETDVPVAALERLA